MPSLTEASAERRRFPREPLDRSAKLFHTPSLRYAQAQTLDLSGGGVLIEARLVRAVFPGDPVRIAIDWLGEGVVGGGEMIEARVIRAEAEADGVRRIALAFNEPIAERVAA